MTVFWVSTPRKTLILCCTVGTASSFRVTGIVPVDAEVGELQVTLVTSASG